MATRKFRKNNRTKYLKYLRKYYKTLAKKVNKRKKSRTRKSRKSHKMRGGYGKGACPFIGPPWNSITGGNYFAHSPYGIRPGGLEPFPGNNSPSPQHGGTGGLLEQIFINPYRELENTIVGLKNTYQGQNSSPSPRPSLQPKYLV